MIWVLGGFAKDQGDSSVRRFFFSLSALAVVVGALVSIPTTNDLGAADKLKVPDSVLQAEKKRIAVVNKAKPTAVAILNRQGNNGGSGVLIDDQGYALTNYHVVAATGPTPLCGLSNGILYEGVVVGIDKVGDVALIKLLPKKEGDKFPFSPMGDSDTVKPGDWSIAMGNPFLLATDFSPSVSYGIVSGVNRYQYPDGQGGLLEYTDCIQFDTAINPGNSGGPLFNMKGEIVGINGRGSFDKRARINSGVGYAISINQIKNFLMHLRAGLDADHATLGATISSASEDGDLSTMVVQDLLEESDVFRRGIKSQDTLISFAGRPLTSVNQYKNILGVFPRDWRLPLTYRSGSTRKETLVRLMPNQASVIQPKEGGGRPPIPPKGPPGGGPGGPAGPGAKMYEARKGFANYYFNRLELDRLLASFKKHGDFTSLTKDWTWSGTYERDRTNGNFEMSYSEEKLDPTKEAQPVVKIKMGETPYQLEPTAIPKNATELDLIKLVEPPFSGGLMMAFYQYRLFLTMLDKGYGNDRRNIHHGGMEPVYFASLDGKPKSFKDQRINAEVVNAENIQTKCKFFFYRAEFNPQFEADKHPYADGMLIAAEIWPMKDKDPCELYFHDFKEVEGRKLPHTIEVRHGDNRYALIRLNKFNMK